jgi:hypothetical protein
VLPKAERQSSAQVRRRVSERDRKVAVIPREHAMADLSIFGATAEVIAAYDNLDQLARADGEKQTLDQLRADIALDLLASRGPPQARPRP